MYILSNTLKLLQLIPVWIWWEGNTMNTIKVLNFAWEKTILNDMNITHL
jgi:hypothetical protein